MTKKKRLELLDEAKRMGLKSVTIDDVIYEIGSTKQSGPIREAEARELLTPMSVFDDYSDDEILYYATPYFDELQDMKEKRKQQLKDEGI